MGEVQRTAIIVRFINWFEARYPREPYQLKETVEGVCIIRENGQVITYCEYYATDQLRIQIGGSEVENEARHEGNR